MNQVQTTTRYNMPVRVNHAAIAAQEAAAARARKSQLEQVAAEQARIEAERLAEMARVAEQARISATETLVKQYGDRVTDILGVLVKERYLQEGTTLSGWLDSSPTEVAGLEAAPSYFSWRPKLDKDPDHLGNVNVLPVVGHPFIENGKVVKTADGFAIRTFDGGKNPRPDGDEDEGLIALAIVGSTGLPCSTTSGVNYGIDVPQRPKGFFATLFASIAAMFA
jgi:hypothetical protein